MKSVIGELSFGLKPVVSLSSALLLCNPTLCVCTCEYARVHVLMMSDLDILPFEGGRCFSFKIIV